MNIYEEEERIDTQVESINFKGYLILQGLVLCVLLMKIVFINVSMLSISTEVLILLSGNLYILIRSLLLRVNLMNFLKGCDEFNLIYRNKIFSQGFYLCFILIGMMTITILLIGKMNLCYFLAIEFFLPGIYGTYKTMKEGLLIPRIKASKKNTRKRYILILLIVFLCILGSDWEFLKSDKSLIMKTARIMFDILMDILFIIIPTHFTVKALGKKSQENDKKFNN